MIFQKRRVKVNLKEDFFINGIGIGQVDKTKFLGVIIDETLNFEDHLKYIRGKISRSLGILYKGKKYFDKTTLMTLYNVFVYPYFTYCIEIWGNTYQSYLDPLFKLQKRAIRIISFSERMAHTSTLFKNLKLLRLNEIYIYFVQLFMFKYYHSTLPREFSSFFFSLNAEIHNYPTRL